MNHPRLYVDMDGTLAKFTPVLELETLFEKGYFQNLTPQANVVNAVKEIVAKNPFIEVFVLSAYLTDSKYAVQEKHEWLNTHLPEIDQDHRVFVPCGSCKRDFITGLGKNDFLLDDYTKNLLEWQPPATGIKLLNDINHSHGSWEHDRVRFDKEPSTLASNIVSIICEGKEVYDEKPERRHEVRLASTADATLMKSGSKLFLVSEPDKAEKMISAAQARTWLQENASSLTKEDIGLALYTIRSQDKEI
jgi:5'(3')-deoxyribonucleotidase